MAEGKFVKSGKDGSVLKARDVEFELQSVSIDPVVKSILIRLADINHTNVKSISEIALMVDRMADIVGNFGKIAENMKDTIQKMGMREADVDDDITTHSNN